MAAGGTTSRNMNSSGNPNVFREKKTKQNKTKIVMFWIIDNIYDHMVRDQILPLVCVPKIPVKPAATLAFLVALYCEGKCGMKGKAHRL